jgi:thymidylate synthase ThyX
MIQAKILLDSLNPINRKRLITWELTYHRFFHAEIMTHRVFSRNAASSRAIPIKKILDEVKTNPAIPLYWGKNQPGMKAREELDDVIQIPRKVVDVCYFHGREENGMYKLTDREFARQKWLEARDSAVEHVEEMIALNLHKQVANRILEPWMHMTAIVSSTEYENFFALRAHDDAQPEFKVLADAMLEQYNTHIPTELKPFEWHIPFGDKMPEGASLELKLKIATARCARASYLTFNNEMNVEKDLMIHDSLSADGHWSPFEHCACATPNGTGNFRGWTQYRSLFPSENKKDSRLVLESK